jgi:hypothetical protein
MFSPQDSRHEEDSESETLSSSESLIISQYLDAHSDLQSSPSSSYCSVDTQPYGHMDEEKDAENILAFIATLDALSVTNATGWTHEKASLALDARRRRRQADPDVRNTERSAFDFFSHFDPTLRSHLRDSYDRHKSWGYTGDASQGLSLDVATLQVAKLQSLMTAIGVAIDTPAQESQGQILKRKYREDMERTNRELDEYDGRFEGTWKGVLNSTIALGSVAGNYLRKKTSV